MRRASSIIILFVLLLTTAAAYAQSNGELAPPEIPGEAVYIAFPVDIALDGDLADWDGIPTVTVDKGPMPSADPAENGSFTFAVAADAENLFVTMSMPDQNIVAGQHGTDFWNEDSFEFYVNASGDLGAVSYKDKIVQINVNATNIGNTDPDALSISGINVTGLTVRGIAFETTNGWGIEVAVPLDGLLEPKHGLEIGFQAQINGAAEADRDVKLIWSNADTSDVSWSNPSVFGRALFFEIGQTDIPIPGEATSAEGVEEAVPVENLIKNGDFSSGQDNWWAAGNPTIDADAGELCVTITDAGANQWDVIVGQNGVLFLEGQSYSLTFDARASQIAKVNARVQMEAAPYTTYYARDVELTTEMQSYGYTFTSSDTDEAAAFQFQMGGQGTPTICFDNVMLEGPGAPPELTRTPVSDVRVYTNQVGYLPDAPKRATVVSDSTSPLDWELVDGNENDKIVLSGSTTVFGDDDASGDHVHMVDFSDFTTTGSDYILKVADDISYPFSISPDTYNDLKYDALAYFYHNRSGIEIALPYAGAQEWTRPAGHIGVEPNKGDTEVTCFAGTDSRGQEWPGCDYALDVSGGWYDAGDHGKYVVNGGISVWTLMNQYERALRLGSSVDAFADGSMAIPENDNDVPDILDEARWEMEFLLRMQIPASTDDPMAGMVHHKVHDAAWTGIPTSPDRDTQPRFLYPPTTAATLNLAATAAQCARLWEDIDEDFSQQCLIAAEIAWDAATANPDVYHSDFDGGGSYGDGNVSDEFYWAAAELAITTGEDEYKDYLEKSSHFVKLPVADGSSMTWQSTAALGTISLAVVPNDLGDDDIDAARANLVAAADTYVKALNDGGYRVPFDPGDHYPWGSNSFILNNMIIVALAYDFTGNEAYLEGVSEGMDYLLGRNPMGQSYITGYGELPLQNPHHRFWAHQANPGFPSPPPGVVSGGPNSGLEDPYAQPLLSGCAPQKCFVDHIESWSTNEITINWNAPLAWVAAFLDEKSDWQPAGTAEVEATIQATEAAGNEEAQPATWIYVVVIGCLVVAAGVAIWFRVKGKRIAAQTDRS
ncbi:MAG: glycoside hydrolase family 9 protein [Anaerolineae bacterium]|nr:glycoside hydrolase family 9 protein [Anaerolineae bacterium]